MALKQIIGVSNLEWVTAKENIRHAISNGLARKASGSEHHLSKVVLDFSTGIFYESAGQAARIKGYNVQWLINRLNGRVKNKTSLVYT